MFLKNDPCKLDKLIDRACKLTGKTQLELEELDYLNECSDSIFKCICKKCPSLNICYDGLEVIE